MNYSHLSQNCSSRESSLAELMVKEEELVQKEELVKCLQEELVQVRPLVVVVVVVVVLVLQREMNVARQVM